MELVLGGCDRITGAVSVRLHGNGSQGTKPSGEGGRQTFGSESRIKVGPHAGDRYHGRVCSRVWLAFTPTCPGMKRSLLTLVFCASAITAPADEGMWLFDQPPRQLLRKHHQFDATEAWLEHLQKSSVRFNSGGSGSFVSEDGLLISNHHVGADALQKLSTKAKNHLHDGFYACMLNEEIRCFDLELNVLETVEDVTARIHAAVPKDPDATAAFAARRAIIAEFE